MGRDATKVGIYFDMSENQLGNEKKRGGHGRSAPKKRKKRLGIKQIREFVDQIAVLPAGAALPDLSHLSIGERFAIALRLIPAAQREATLKRSPQQIARYESGTEIPLTSVAALAAAAEIPLKWIVTGRAMERKPPLVYVDAARPVAAGADEVPVQKLAFRASAGSGALAIDEAAGHLRFPRLVLEHVGVRPEHARLMEASGESMRPTINDGDLLLVDISPQAQSIAEGKIYVFSVGEEVFVKRLRAVGGRILIRADNQDLYPGEEPVPPDLPFRLYGRVKWAGRNL